MCVSTKYNHFISGTITNVKFNFDSWVSHDLTLCSHDFYIQKFLFYFSDSNLQENAQIVNVQCNEF